MSSTAACGSTFLATLAHTASQRASAHRCSCLHGHESARSAGGLSHACAGGRRRTALGPKIFSQSHTSAHSLRVVAAVGRSDDSSSSPSGSKAGLAGDKERSMFGGGQKEDAKQGQKKGQEPPRVSAADSFAFPGSSAFLEDEAPPVRKLRPTKPAPSPTPTSATPTARPSSSPSSTPATTAAGAAGTSGSYPSRSSDSHLRPDRALSLPMTAPHSVPMPAEELQERLNCDPEVKNCKEAVYEWTSECHVCSGTGVAKPRRSRKGGKSSSMTCITCCGIGYVYRYTLRNDIPVMEDLGRSS